MRRAVSVGCIAAGLLAAPAQAAVLEEFTFADWSGLALSDDATGQLASCAIYARYQNGATLFFIRHVDGNWTLSLVHDSWALTADSQYPLQYRVDRGSPGDATAVALEADQIAVALSPGDSLLDEVRRGSLLTVLFQGREYGFELSNSAKALAAVGECLERNRTAAGPQIVQNAAPPQPAPVADAEKPPEEASPTGERQRFGVWVVSATQDSAGEFVNCTAFGVYGQDQLLLSYRPDGRWEFGLYRPAWALDPNQTYYLWYNVDAPVEADGVIKRPVEAPEATRIFFEVSGEEDLVARMERGRRLHLQLRGVAREPESLSYPLYRAPEAFGAARECTRRELGGGHLAGNDPARGLTGAERTVAGAPAGAASLPIGSRRIEAFEIPGWAGAAFADEAGAFTHCAVEAAYENGTDLAFLRTAGGSLLVTVRRADWSLPAGARMPFRYKLSGHGPAVLTEAVAVDGSLAAIDLGSGLRADRWRKAEAVEVEIAGKRRNFDLSDLPAALDAADACVGRHRPPAAAAVSPQPNGVPVQSGVAAGALPAGL